MSENYYTLYEITRECSELPEKSDREIYSTNLWKINDYLYTINYEAELDYEYAKAYYLRGKSFSGASGCSSFRNGNWYGRNLDWTYDNQVDFVVKTDRVIGIAGMVPGLNKDTVGSFNTNLDEYKILPFYLLDGINKDGVFCNTNVVPTDKGDTTGTTPAIEKRDTICSAMLPRYILDHFSTATEAIEYINNYVSIYSSKSVKNMGYDLHVMIGDTEKTYILEFVDNTLTWTENKIMTNFFINGVTFNEDGKVNTIIDGQKPSDNGITDFGSGLERYNIIVDNLESVNSENTTLELIKKIQYTNAYTLGNWPSEFVSPTYNITVDTPMDSEQYQYVFGKALEYYKTRTRNKPLTWQTTHSSIYDLQNKCLTVLNQETNTKYKYTL